MRFASIVVFFAVVLYDLLQGLSIDAICGRTGFARVKVSVIVAGGVKHKLEYAIITTREYKLMESETDV